MYGSKTDLSHGRIREFLRSIPGVVVEDLTRYRSFLDLMVGYKGQVYLVEVKNGPADRLTSREEELFVRFPSVTYRVESEEDCLRMLGLDGVSDTSVAKGREEEGSSRPPEESG